MGVNSPSILDSLKYDNGLKGVSKLINTLLNPKQSVIFRNIQHALPQCKYCDNSTYFNTFPRKPVVACFTFFFNFACFDKFNRMKVAHNIQYNKIPRSTAFLGALCVLSA